MDGEQMTTQASPAPIAYRSIERHHRPPLFGRVVSFWQSLTLPQSVLILGVLCAITYIFATWPPRYEYHWQGPRQFRHDRQTDFVEVFDNGSWVKQ